MTALRRFVKGLRLQIADCVRLHSTYSRDRRVFSHKEGVVSPDCQQREAHCGLRQHGSLVPLL